MRGGPLTSAAVALLLATPVAADGDCGRLQLTEVAAAVGLGFTHQRGATGGYQLPETLGSGVAWLDADEDGHLDLYVVQSGPFPPGGADAAANRLYRNLGDGTFADATAGSGADDRGYGQGVTAADVDGDGHTDLYVTNYGPDRLLLGRGDGTFRDATEESGLGLDGWSTSAAFADADGDGDLDLYVVRYLVYDHEHPVVCRDNVNGRQDYCHPNLFAGAHDAFYRNTGGGRFVDATGQAGLAQADGKGLGVVFVDLDDDMAPDLYVANDSTTNFLFRNRGDGTFEDLSLISGTALSREGVPQAGMGVAVGDVDGDGLPDIAVTNLDTETNALYLNRGAAIFEEASASSGFGIPSFNVLGFGIVLSDLDLDGDLDSYITNGNVRMWPSREGASYAMHDLLLLGDGHGRFVRADCVSMGAGPYVGRGLATADYDDDGDPDLALSNSGGPLQLLRNGTDPDAWVGVALRGTAPNTGAVGARVTLRSDAGEQRRWRTAGDSYQSTSDPRMLFGWPAGSRPLEIEVRWPDGEITTVPLGEDDTGRYLVVGRD